MIALALATIAFAALDGCTNASLVRVKPWERAALTDYMMRPDRDPLATANADHIYFSRESATGGGAAEGGGCGCN